MFSSLVELRTRKVQYDALVKSQQVRVDAAMVREWDKWNEFGVTKFLSKKQLNDIMKRKPRPENCGNQMVITEKTIQGKPDYKARLVVQGCQEDKGTSGLMHPLELRDAFLHDNFQQQLKSGWGLQCVRCPVSIPPVRRQSRGLFAVANASQKSASWDEARASGLLLLVRSMG